MSFRCYFLPNKHGKIANLEQSQSRKMLNVKYGAPLQRFFNGTPYRVCQKTMPRPRSRVGIVGTTGCGKCGSPGWDYPEKVAETKRLGKSEGWVKYHNLAQNHG